MRTILLTKKFKKGDKKMQKRGCDSNKLDSIVEQLLRDGILPSRYKPHRLSGSWHPAFECHIENDWLLIYKVEAKEVILYATGTHDDLFG